jgi:hypothetical protein
MSGKGYPTRDTGLLKEIENKERFANFFLLQHIGGVSNENH